jgi:preprotein translocase subunit SecE
MGEIRSERQQRRAQRREQAEARRANRPREARPTGTEERHRSFIHESIAELKKVEWPGQNQVIQGTVVVLVACIVVGVFLYINDEVWKQVVQKVLLGQ